MATMSMMKKALNMGMMEAERAARIFLEALRRPKRRTTRRARRMLTGKSRGPRAARDMRTTRASKRDLVCVCVSVCARACVYVRARARACACVYIYILSTTYTPAAW